MQATPLTLLDAELPTSRTPSRFVVKVKDGREFSQCLLASLKTDSGGKRRLTYYLRYEDMTTPAP